MKNKRNRHVFRSVKAYRRNDRRFHGAAKPPKGEHQVYVARGKCYHPEWCDSMNGIWLDGSNSIRVMEWDDAVESDHTLCGLCRAIIQASKDQKE